MQQEFDIKKIENAVVEALKVSVGQHLSTIPQRINGVSVQTPAVVRSNTLSSTSGKPAPRPEFPYIAVAYTGQTDAHDFSVLKKYIDDQDNFVYQTEINVRVAVTLYGSDINSVNNIANKANMSFKTDKIRELMDKYYEDEDGLLVKVVTDIIPTGIIYNDVETEIREFDIIFSVRNRVKYSLAELGYFDAITVNTPPEEDGGVYSGDDLISIKISTN